MAQSIKCLPFTYEDPNPEHPLKKKKVTEAHDCGLSPWEAETGGS